MTHLRIQSALNLLKNLPYALFPCPLPSLLCSYSMNCMGTDEQHNSAGVILQPVQVLTAPLCQTPYNPMKCRSLPCHPCSLPCRNVPPDVALAPLLTRTSHRRCCVQCRTLVHCSRMQTPPPTPCLLYPTHVVHPPHRPGVIAVASPQKSVLSATAQEGPVSLDPNPAAQMTAMMVIPKAKLDGMLSTRSQFSLPVS